ncbi:MAG: 3-isopropylmalate dehydratase small subunit [Fusobacteriaceae bacterium]|jgi:3-isopropylmalate/(R)-2-methylmalate dehydratase small subunit|nr:3-isopropylmalate dehydratase small subunit [Fusobacteriaceae bacterium]
MIKGKIWKFKDDIDTDVIYPARFMNTSDINIMGTHLMQDYDSDFINKIAIGDIVVAGKNFGCGSSREHAPLALRIAGISCVIAVSFARIFYRNSINTGLAIIECPEAVRESTEGDVMSVDIITGIITNETNGKIYNGQPFPEFIQEIISKGGLIPYIDSEMNKSE